MRARTQQGSALAEALVAVALAGLAIGGLTGAAALASRSLVLVRDTDNALALAGERLETLRAGQRVRRRLGVRALGPFVQRAARRTAIPFGPF